MTRILGRIDVVIRSREGNSLQKPWGYLCTLGWKRYQWHSNELLDPEQELRHGDIVSFEPLECEERPARVMKIKFEARERNPEAFRKLGKETMA